MFIWWRNGGKRGEGVMVVDKGVVMEVDGIVFLRGLDGGI